MGFEEKSVSTPRRKLHDPVTISKYALYFFLIKADIYFTGKVT